MVSVIVVMLAPVQDTPSSEKNSIRTPKQAQEHDPSSCACQHCQHDFHEADARPAQRKVSRTVKLPEHFADKVAGERIVLNIGKSQIKGGVPKPSRGTLEQLKKLEGSVVSRVLHHDGTQVQIIKLLGERKGKLVLQTNEKLGFFLGQVYFDEGIIGWELKRGQDGEFELIEHSLDEMICARIHSKNQVALGLPENIEVNHADSDADSGNPEASAQQVVPFLNSRSSATAVVYLDFDGQTVTGTSWNDSDNPTINAAAVDYTASKITSIWERVSADMEPFDINVTTDESVYLAAPSRRRIRCIITPSSSWFGSAGGVAYLGSFRWSGDTPCWVFANLLGHSTKSVAEAASHEVGHTFGLGHDGQGSTEYYRGHGSGVTGWAPIMGVGYSRTLVQWSKGEYSNASNTQDDLAIITSSSNGFGYRDDDHGNTRSNATSMTIASPTQVDAEGVLERNTDADVFSFQSQAGQISFTVSPESSYSNIDTQLELYDSSGQLLGSADVENTQSATLSVNVTGGQYYIYVKPAGERTVSTGYSNYASLGAYRLVGTVVQAATPVVEILSPTNSSVRIPEHMGLVLEGSVTDSGPVNSLWETVSAPAGATVTFGNASAASTDARFSSMGTYVLRLSGTDDTETVSKQITVKVGVAGPENLGANIQITHSGQVGVMTTIGTVLTDNDGPSALEIEWTQIAGPTSAIFSNTSVNGATVQFPQAGDYRLRVTVDDGITKTFDELELESRIQSQNWINSMSTFRVSIPSNGDDHAVWRNLGYNDQGWTTGNGGVGYERSSGYNSYINTNVSQMYQNIRTCRIRIPFYVAQASAVELLKLRMRYDDAFVAYLNGTEVARSTNTPTGQPAWNAGATSGHSDSSAVQWIDFDLTGHIGLLQHGENILAIHGLNYLTSSSDFLIDAELTGTAQETEYLRALANSGVNTSAPEASLTSDVDGDGFSNLLEHGLGMNVFASDATLPVFQRNPEGKMLVELSSNMPTDMTLHLQASSTMQDNGWETIATRGAAGVWVAAQNNITITKTTLGNGKDQLSIDEGGVTAGIRFYRFQVESR